MRLLHLLLALQSLTDGSRVNAADSSIARRTLLAGLAAFDSVSANVLPNDMAFRYLEQMQIWGLKAQGDEAAVRFDRAARRLHGYGSTANSSAWIATLLKNGDTTAADALVARLPDESRDHVIVEVTGHLFGMNRPDIMARLESRMIRPWPRAKLVRDRAWRMMGRDSVAGRAILAEAINLSMSDSSGLWDAWKYMVELLHFGGQAAVGDIVATATRAGVDSWNARALVVGALNEHGMPHLTGNLIDSLEAGIPALEPSKQLEARLEVLLLRGTREDSAKAELVRDSIRIIDASTPEALREHLVARERSALYSSGSPTNPEALRVALVAPLTDDALLSFLEYLRGITLYGSGDTLRAYVRVALDRSGPMVRSRPAVLRDSMQVYRVIAQSFLDARVGLELAKSIPTRRFRDRAIGEAAARLAPNDAVTAEQEARSLQDSTARANTFGALSRNATSALRFVDAAALATNSSGDEQVRAWFELASKHNESGRPSDARAIITRGLSAVNPELRCDGCLGPAPGFAPIPSTRGTNPDLMAEVIFLMAKLGMREQLLAWAASLQGVASIANANLMIVEAFSRAWLRWSPPLRLNY